VWRHLREFGVAPDMFLLDAWLTLFSRWLPFAMLWGVFELVCMEGFTAVLALTAEVLRAHEEALMGAGSFEELFVLLKALPAQRAQPDARLLLEATRALLPSATEAMSGSENRGADSPSSSSVLGGQVEETAGPTLWEGMLTVVRRGPRLIFTHSDLHEVDPLNTDLRSWRGFMSHLTEAAHTAVTMTSACLPAHREETASNSTKGSTKAPSRSPRSSANSHKPPASSQRASWRCRGKSRDGQEGKRGSRLCCMGKSAARGSGDDLQ